MAIGQALGGPGFSDVHSDATAVIAHHPAGITVQIECLNGRGFNAAYISTAYTSSRAAFQPVHDAVLRAVNQ